MNNRMMAVHSASFALRQAIRHTPEANIVIKAVTDAFSDALFSAREADHGLDLLSERVYLLAEGCSGEISESRRAALSEAAYEALTYSSKALVREGEAILSDIGRNYEVWLDPATDELRTSPSPGSVCLGTLPPGVDARAYAEAAWQEREAAHAD